jgi:hypothetical protein
MTLNQVHILVGNKWDEVTGGWRRLDKQQLHDFISSPNIIRMIKLRIMTWAGHVARMGERRCAYSFWVRKPEERDRLEDFSINEKIILNWIFKKWDGGMEWIDMAQDRDVVGCCENGNEPSGPIKCGEFLE